MASVNDDGQQIGDELGSWRPPAGPPSGRELRGAHVRLERLDPALHAPGLAAAFADAPDTLWTYMSFGPFAGVADLEATLAQLVSSSDWQPYAIVTDAGTLGFCSYLRIDRNGGVIEIGSIAFSPALQRTTAATECLFLLIDHAFASGYRRVEWKCDDLNEPSRRAAIRLGFRYEGTFRKATHYKGRNRDTAWFAIVDDDWPAIRGAFVRWLAPDNFDSDGEQRLPLSTPHRT